MTYKNAFSIDELVKDRRHFVNKIVPINGKLVKYKMGPGCFIWPLELKVEGEQRKITANCKISRYAGDHKKIRPYLDAYLGHEIGLKVFANNYTITHLKFGDDEYLFG